ncbi:hypothetical protein [Mycobacterium botniense]|uniref:Uncharacterized protein n=1 Tax=Mycobacterium botniense TaxID=84962 RepID=A0A7I9Y1U7_9MYCO|nr:hypothetical protein [Mycobacterium botniense]GFG76048.1 hypothetical protein MBOT_34130 [Mycobacterium botniense]
MAGPTPGSPRSAELAVGATGPDPAAAATTAGCSATGLGAAAPTPTSLGPAAPTTAGTVGPAASTGLGASAPTTAGTVGPAASTPTGLGRAAAPTGLTAADTDETRAGGQTVIVLLLVAAVAGAYWAGAHSRRPPRDDFSRRHSPDTAGHPAGYPAEPSRAAPAPGWLWVLGTAIAILVVCSVRSRPDIFGGPGLFGGPGGLFATLLGP